MSRASCTSEPLRAWPNHAIYLLKEISGGTGKLYQKQAPPGFKTGRWWGMGGPTKPKRKCAVEMLVSELEKAGRVRREDGLTYVRTRWNTWQDLQFALDANRGTGDKPYKCIETLVEYCDENETSPPP